MTTGWTVARDEEPKPEDGNHELQRPSSIVQSSPERDLIMIKVYAKFDRLLTDKSCDIAVAAGRLKRRVGVIVCNTR